MHITHRVLIIQNNCTLCVKKKANYQRRQKQN